MKSALKLVLSAFTALFLLSSLASCKSKSASREENKKDLLAEIEHYGIEPVDTTGKEALGSPDVNDILRHYPELYHGTERAMKFYKKWAETERAMISTVFVGKSRARVATAKKAEAKLEHCLTQRSLTQMLDYVLLDGEEVHMDSFTDSEETGQLYLDIMARIVDGVAANAEHTTTDEMKSAVGYARRAWKEYADALQQMVSCVPETARARYVKAVNETVQQHKIDLLNRYYPYYENESPGWLLPYDATDDAIKNFAFDAFHDRDWVE